MFNVYFKAKNSKRGCTVGSVTSILFNHTLEFPISTFTRQRR